MAFKDTIRKLKTLLERDVNVLPVKLKNIPGFIPEYFDYADRNCASKLFSETEDGALENLLKHLEEKKPGGNDGTDTNSQ